MKLPSGYPVIDLTKQLTVCGHCALKLMLLLLFAQAISDRLQLVTSDALLSEYSEPVVVV